MHRGRDRGMRPRQGRGTLMDLPFGAPELPPIAQRLLHRYWRFSRGVTLGVRAAVLDAENRVFLVRHTYVAGWQLPGGGVEPGETAPEALARELREEAAIELAGAAGLHGVYLNRYASDRDHVLLYVVRAFRVLSAKAPDREIAEAGFFPLDALPDGVTPATAARLREIAGGSPPAALW
jgi:8-oxo-dGTP pyrophosphatase MutT (NUDIX family)